MGQSLTAHRLTPTVPTLSTHPQVGSTLICNYGTGFVAPEMVKRRPVVVISRLRRRADLCTVVPLSTTAVK